ncbi:alanine--glyoxylate aminotransferase family protein [Oceanicella sp. SM1341]|uniref:pyridoxal-phosphate-dependent aminotransferase family protein n=1 Tax=Oceanicella sp. SM1341 TaxID=1548889 RepID=UPI000E52B7A4|nr:aminotransferase class V-fold PLP-dependent enzyme [Oceanicella sp. SM1341]
MSLAHGRHFLSIPGPSVMPDRVLNAMHQAAPNIYEGDIITLTAEVFDNLAKIGRTTEAKPLIYMANGHGAWEASLTNTFSRGDTALVLFTGRFARGWAEQAERLGINVQSIDFGPRSPVDPQQVEDALRADTAGKIRAVMMVQTDTATSVLNDVPAVRAAIDAAGHSALLMVDCIASFACDAFEMDAWGVDVMVTGSQKGLMTPPGLGMNYVGPRALESRERADLATPYWDWKPRCNPQVYYQQFCGTAPTHHLFGLHAATSMILEEGIENVWARHVTLSKAVHAAVEAWGQGGPLECNIAEPAHRSRAVTSIRTGSIDANALRRYCEDELGLTLGVGLPLGSPVMGGREEGVFRIGHMGHLSPPMILGTLASIETALTALNMPHGQGAVAAAAAVIAGH